MNYIKAVENTDFQIAIRLAKNSFLTTTDSNLNDWFSSDEMIKNVNSSRGICLVACDDENQAMGMIYAQQESPINGKEGLEKWVIIIMGTDPKNTGKGIGSGLLKELEKEIKLLGCKKLFVYTNKGDDKVVNFYKINNFIDAGWIKDYQYGENNSAVFLLKYL